MMQLSVCLAVPPYNFLRGGKLMAALAFTDPIQEEFRKRYNKPGTCATDQLLALVTTSAAGDPSAIFNRIHVRAVFSQTEREEYAGELYRRIGWTSGHTSLMLSDETVKRAQEMARLSPGRALNGSGESGDRTRDRNVARALRECGISATVLELWPMALHLGCLSVRNLDMLRRGDDTCAQASVPYEAERVVEYWRAAHMVKALANARARGLLQDWAWKGHSLGELLDVSSRPAQKPQLRAAHSS
jgi:hypothetical protein